SRWHRSRRRRPSLEGITCPPAPACGRGRYAWRMSAEAKADPGAPSKEEIAGHLARAITLAVENVDRRGGPFGALIVTADGRRFEGVNRVTVDNDPTAHAEVSAIRAACRALGTFDL